VASAEAFAVWPRMLDLLRRRTSLTAAERTELDDVGERVSLAALAGDVPGSGWPGAAALLEAEGWPTLEALLRIDGWPQFAARFGDAPDAFLAAAVRGFFDNGGDRCYVLRLNDVEEPLMPYRIALGALGELADVDLVCAPDATQPSLAADRQRLVLEHCDRTGTLFALLDSLPGAGPSAVVAQRDGLVGRAGALYFPWLVVRGDAGTRRIVPPCGHVAGVYARSDRAHGVHKAPANEVLEGVLDLETMVADAAQGELNVAGVNVVRAFRGRGIRVWGARTMSRDPAWRYVNVQRIFSTAARWIETALADAPFEPNERALWTHTRLLLSRYLADLYRRGALRGAAASEAFYVRCDETTNPPDVRDAGRLVAEIGLAPSLPNEFVVVHITRSADGVTITGPGPG
jgi:hypothetical protein